MSFAASNPSPRRSVYLLLLLNVSFMLLWVGQLISYLGDRLDQLTLLRLVQHDPRIDTDAVMTWIGFYTLLPFVLFAAWAGPAADRYSRKAILIWTNLCLGVLVAAIPFVGPSPFVQRHLIGMIYLVTFLIGGFTIFFYTAKTALIPQLVGDDELMAANSLSSFAGTLMTLLGTFVASALLALIDRGVLNLSIMFYLDAASYFICAAMFVFIGVRRPRTLAARAAEESFGRKLREGLAYVNRHRRVLKLVALSVAVNFLAGLVFAVVNGALLGKSTLNWPITDYALGVGILGVGMLAGAVAATLGQKRIRSFEAFVAGCFLVVAVMILPLMGLHHERLIGLSKWAILGRKLAAPLFIIGMCGGALIVFVVTLLQRTVPPHFHGRVFALNGMCEVSAELLAMGLGGLLLKAHLFKTVILGGSAVALLAMLGTLLSNEFLRHRVVRGVARLFVRAYCRFESEGQEHVPRRGPLIVASNHVSWLDTVFLGVAVPRLIHYLAAREYYDLWYLKWAMWLYGTIPIEPGRRLLGPFKRAFAALREERVIGVFPEGRMSDTGEFLPLQGGVALLADESGAPILPVAILGAGRVLGRPMRFPRPYKVRVRIGRPIDPAGLSRAEILARLDAAIRALLHERNQ